MEKGPRVTVSGVVRDAATGEPVAGIEVYGLPRGKDIPWEPPSMTDEQGRFTLRLTAPAKYAFLLRDHGISILTPEKDDPGYVDIVTKPGEKIEGVELKFLREKFQTPP